MTSKVLILGGVTFPVLAAIQINQSYEYLGGASVLRTLKGAGIKQEHWSKRATSVQATSWLPPPFASLNFKEPLLMSCIQPISAAGPSASIDIDEALSGHRTDSGHTPYGYGFTPGGAIKTTASIAGNTATVAAVSGATSYMAIWYPEFYILSNGPSQDFDRANAVWNWSIDGEEP